MYIGFIGYWKHHHSELFFYISLYIFKYNVPVIIFQGIKNEMEVYPLNIWKKWNLKKLLLIVIVSFCILLSFTGTLIAGDVKTITDMAGRKVKVPSTINKVFGANSVASITLYTLAPEKLIGWNYKFNDQEKEFLLYKYRNLPVYGIINGSSTSANLEVVVKAAPDICVFMGSINDATKKDADKLQSQLGIPAVMLDDALEKTSDTYKFLGVLLNKPEQANKLSSYSYHAINGVKYRAIPESKRVSIYFGNGAKSLNTAPVGSTHAEVLALVKANNVVKVDQFKAARIDVTLEQVIAWNPQVIIVNGEPTQNFTGSKAKDAILQDKNWSSIQAVKNGRVYNIPKSPFAWVDRPLGPNRIIGLKWLGKTLYPEYYTTFDMIDEIKTFYRLFYHMDLTDAQVNKLLTQ